MGVLSLDFSNETYVRLYVRDTVTWLALGWQARTTFLHLLRCFDRAGVFDTSGRDHAKAISIAARLPLDLVAEGLAELVEEKVVVLNGWHVVAPKFLEAQECIKSDKARAKEYRSRRRSQSLEGSVTNSDERVTLRDGSSREITERHAANETSRGVTLSSADLNSALLTTTVHPTSVVAVAATEKVGRAWYAALTERLDPELPSAPAAYEFFGRQPAEERATVAANLRASAVHGSLKARRALRPQRIVDALWHTHLLSAGEHMAQKSQYANNRAQPPAATPPKYVDPKDNNWLKATGEP